MKNGIFILLAFIALSGKGQNKIDGLGPFKIGKMDTSRKLCHFFHGVKPNLSRETVPVPL
jgi:hypothetical protein